MEAKKVLLQTMVKLPGQGITYLTEKEFLFLGAVQTIAYLTFHILLAVEQEKFISMLTCMVIHGPILREANLT